MVRRVKKKQQSYNRKRIERKAKQRRRKSGAGRAAARENYVISGLKTVQFKTRLTILFICASFRGNGVPADLARSPNEMN